MCADGTSYLAADIVAECQGQRAKSWFTNFIFGRASDLYLYLYKPTIFTLVKTSFKRLRHVSVIIDHLQGVI